MFNRGNIPSDCFVLTKSDTAEVSDRFVGLYVGGTGDITVINQSGQSVVFTACPVGFELTCGGIKRVMSTGTTATLLVGFLA